MRSMAALREDALHRADALVEEAGRALLEVQAERDAAAAAAGAQGLSKAQKRAFGERAGEAKKGVSAARARCERGLRMAPRGAEGDVRVGRATCAAGR